MNKYTLRFLDRNEEIAYCKSNSLLKENLSLKINVFGLLFTIVLTTISIINTILSLISNEGYKFDFELTMSILWPTAFLMEFIFQCKEQLVKFHGVGIIIVCFYYLTEMKLAYYSFDLTTLNVSCLTSIAVSCGIALGYSKDWIFSSLSLLIGCLYYLLRIICCTSQELRTISQVFKLLLSIIIIYTIFVLLIYFHEIVLRYNFYICQQNKRKKKSLKILIKELPISLLWIKNGIPIFANQKLEEILNDSSHLENEEPNLQLSSREAKKEYLNDTLPKKLELIKNEESDICFWEAIQAIAKSGHSFVDSNKFYIVKNNRRNIIRIKEYELLLDEIITKIYTFENLTAISDSTKKIELRYQKMLIASFSHEIRTPINGSLGLIDHMRTQQISLEFSDQLNIVYNCNLRLLYYIDLLQDYSLLESDQFEIKSESFSLIKSIQNIYNILKEDLNRKNLSFHINRSNHNFEITSYKARIQLVLFILISNATKYTYEGSISVKVQYDQETQLIVINVEDTGIGIETSRIDSLFNLYSGILNSNNLNPQGIGLGLYVSRKLSQKLNGDLTVQSENRRGSSFKFSFRPTNKIELCIENEIVNVTCQNSISNSVYSPRLKSSIRLIDTNSTHFFPVPRFLLVDDDPTNIQVLQNYLSGLNETADTALNGLQACNIIKEKIKQKEFKYKAIFMDINMPVMDGELASIEIKTKIYTNEYFAPIIAVTAAHVQSESDIVKLKGDIFDDFILKPVSRKIFIEKVKNYF